MGCGWVWGAGLMGGIGPKGEAAAERFLRKLGLRTLDRNVRFVHGELDLVCREGSVLVFVEVKARSRAGHLAPQTVLSEAKKQRLRRAAATYLAQIGGWRGQIRFDLVTALAMGDGTWSLEHHRSAFRGDGLG